MKPSLSIIVPVLNEEGAIAGLLRQLRQQFPGAQCVVVDGGSNDATVERARGLCAEVLQVAPGRAAQMNAGAALATGDYLVFLHADTRPSFSEQQFCDYLADRPLWGFCQVQLRSELALLQWVERGMNWRSQATSVATGDQMLWLRRDVFEQVGGYAAIPLMEDVALSKTLRRLCPPRVVSLPVQTSARRWEQHGVVTTVVKMWCLRLAYFVGVPPRVLWRYYYG